MPENEHRFPTGRQVGWLIGGGMLLGLSSCFGFVTLADSALGPLLAMGFFAGVLAVLCGIVMAVFVGVRSVFTRQ